MKRRFVFAILCLSATPHPLCGADVFRVEWLSGRSVKALKFSARRNSIRLCSASSPENCLTVEPGDSAKCNSTAKLFKCQTANASLDFHRFTAVSKSPFTLSAESAKSGIPNGRKSANVPTAEIGVARERSRIILPVDLETYVAGVLRGEAGILRSPPALQAMAVVARTWALRSRGRHHGEGFNFCSLTHCQVFDPSETFSNGNSDAISEAVRATHGQVLKYHGKLIDVYFSADCGGMTEAAQNVWPDRAEPYLASAKDPYCAGSDHSSWQQTIPLQTLAAIFHGDAAIALPGALRDLKIDARDDSGRAHFLRLNGASARHIDANEFRFAVNRRFGWNTLKSNLYSIERRGDELVFTGRGLGHGVGLCQAGAERMGQLGIGWEKILAAYFPGTQSADSSSVAQSDPVLSSEHFELIFPDNQEALANEALRSLESARGEIESMDVKLPPKMRVKTYATTTDFVSASGQPGWAAASTDGQSIMLQPLTTLRRKNILASTLRHELAHIAVHARLAPKVPRWFEEGMVLWLTKEKTGFGSNFNFGGRSLEQSVSQPRSENEMKAAYALALKRVSRLARERGPAGLWKILENPTPGDLKLINEGK